MALREALANAIVHGNQRDSRKCVHVACRCTTDGGVSITVQDEGQGSTPTWWPIRPLRTIDFLQGQGIYLMKTLMDESSFRAGRQARLCSCGKHLTRNQRQKDKSTIGLLAKLRSSLSGSGRPA